MVSELKTDIEGLSDAEALTVDSAVNDGDEELLVDEVDDCVAAEELVGIEEREAEAVFDPHSVVDAVAVELRVAILLLVTILLPLDVLVPSLLRDRETVLKREGEEVDVIVFVRENKREIETVAEPVIPVELVNVAEFDELKHDVTVDVVHALMIDDIDFNTDEVGHALVEDVCVTDIVIKLVPDAVDVSVAALTDDVAVANAVLDSKLLCVTDKVGFDDSVGVPS